MAVVNNPRVTVKLIPDTSVYGLMSRRLLIVGVTRNDDLFEDGSKTAYLSLSNTTSYEQLSIKDVRSMIGEGETLQRFRMAQAVTQRIVPIDFLLVKNDAAEAAGKTINITGVPKISTTVSMFIFDKNKYSVSIDYTAGQTADELAVNLAEAFDRINDAPFSIAVSASTLTVKYKDGTCLDYIPIHIDCADRALKATFGSEKVLPTLPQNDLFDILSDIRFTGVLWPEYFESKKQVLINFLSARFNAENAVMDGRGYIGATGDLVGLQTLYNGINSQHIVVPCSPQLDRPTYHGCANFITNDMYCAFLAGAVALSQTEGADVTDLVSGADGLRDYTGGNHMASLPLHGMPVSESTVTPARLYWMQSEQDILTEQGFSTWGVNSAGNTVVSGECRTMWKTDAGGNENDTWTQLEFVETSSVVRELTSSWLRISTAKQRMTEGELVTGLSMINEESLMEKYVVFYGEIADNGLVARGAEATKLLRANTRFTFIPGKTKISMTGRNTIVSHVGAVDYTLQITQNLS